MTHTFSEISHLLQKRDFTVIFRSFGEDIPAVIEEMNLFCTGQHPQFPNVIFPNHSFFHIASPSLHYSGLLISLTVLVLKNLST